MTDDLLETLREIVARLQAQGIEYMLVGSIAALAHGRSRSTQDFDVVIDATVAQLRRLLRSLPEDRFYASEDAAMESVRHQTQFNVIDMRTGWKADIIPKKRRTFSEVEFDRRAELSVLGQLMQVASLEDTIIAKLEWAKMGGGSERQLEDVRELVRLGGQRLDRAHIERWVAALRLEQMWAQALEP